MTPSWAAKIWVIDEWLYLELPSTIEGGQGHTIKFSITDGLDEALRLIRSRHAYSKIGTDGALTQAQVAYDEAMVRRVKAKQTFPTELSLNARAVLRKIGMI